MRSMAASLRLLPERSSVLSERDWPAIQQAMKKRIHLYDHHVGLVVEQLRA
jgi:isocitrate dehydrogenase kinase/phosphatase